MAGATVTARSPSVTVTRRASPSRGSDRTGSEAQSRAPSSETRISGAPKAARPISGKTSGSAKRPSTSTVSASPRWARATPPSSGTRAAHDAIAAAASRSTPEPRGRSSASETVSGTQMSEHTSSLASIASRAGSPGRSSVTSSGNRTSPP